MKHLTCIIAVCLSAMSVNAQFQGTDRFLVPLYVAAPLDGALASKWVTEFAILNDANDPVHIFGWDQQCPIDPCEGVPAPPHVTFFPALMFWATGVQGIYIRVPHEDAAHVSMHLRVRDLSRASISWGAEIPIVHESEAREVIRLLDIPTDPDYRRHVRVYDLTPTQGAQATIRVFGVDPTTTNPVGESRADPLLVESQTPFLFPFGGWGTQLHPAYAEFFLPDAGALNGFERVRVEVGSSSPLSRIWAFASITNNETQQVSIVAPE